MTDGYRRVPEEWVEADVLAVVKRTARATSIDLGIPMPAVRWFKWGTYPGCEVAKPATDTGSNLRGFVRDIDPMTVYLACDLRIDEAAKYAAHEVRHAYQGQRPGRIAPRDEEADAQQYADRWVRQQKGIAR